MSFKERAKKLQQKAQGFGYEIKLTHAQEILAFVDGHSNRHVALAKEKEYDFFGEKLTHEEAKLAKTVLNNLYEISMKNQFVQYNEITKMIKNRIKHINYLYSKDNSLNKERFKEKMIIQYINNYKIYFCEVKMNGARYYLGLERTKDAKKQIAYYLEKASVDDLVNGTVDTEGIEIIREISYEQYKEVLFE